MKFTPQTGPLVALVIALILALSGCGQTGALYLPSDVPAASEDAASGDAGEDEQNEDPTDTSAPEAP